MPSIVHGVVINRIGVTGSFNIGDTYEVTPKVNVKDHHGSGSGNSGFSINTFNGVSKTNVRDTETSDQNQTFNL
ncbi:spore germination protein [Ectobacillus panaciterrae]|uniref:spore germination protein n=1 Tax=Ectobacillus panaciterrae TaxID=363872 RepID=UPI00048D622B|nr:spore germination protein [Ectobacillus panaciterrae]